MEWLEIEGQEEGKTEREEQRAGECKDFWIEQGGAKKCQVQSSENNAFGASLRESDGSVGDQHTVRVKCI